MTKIVNNKAPARMGIPNSMLRAMLPPSISASEVEMDASMADESRILEYFGLGKWQWLRKGKAR